MFLFEFEPNIFKKKIIIDKETLESLLKIDCCYLKIKVYLIKSK